MFLGYLGLFFFQYANGSKHTELCWSTLRVCPLSLMSGWIACWCIMFISFGCFGHLCIKDSISNINKCNGAMHGMKNNWIVGFFWWKMVRFGWWHYVDSKVEMFSLKKMMRLRTMHLSDVLIIPIFKIFPFLSMGRQFSSSLWIIWDFYLAYMPMTPEKMKIYRTCIFLTPFIFLLWC